MKLGAKKFFSSYQVLHLQGLSLVHAAVGLIAVLGPRSDAWGRIRRSPANRELNPQSSYYCTYTPGCMSHLTVQLVPRSDARGRIRRTPVNRELNLQSSYHCAHRYSTEYIHASVHVALDGTITSKISRQRANTQFTGKPECPRVKLPTLV